MKISTKNKPGRKNKWKDKSREYVRLFTQLPVESRDLIKSSVHGGYLKGEFESVDHFVNEAVTQLMKEYNLIQ